MDSQGKIHLGNQLKLCLVATSSLSIAECDNEKANQHWQYIYINDEPDRLALKASSGHCADLNNSLGIISLYNCHGNWNQRWLDLPQSNEPWLALLPADTLKEVLQLIR